ncbi:MAG: hypothetical protein ACR2OV_15510 [Hyphomicrobiaceae bacterium]
MLYMVEMDLADRTRQAAWHDWYESHIRKLLKVDGFNGSQRFQCLTPTPSPFLAIHDVSGPEFFESAAYRNVGGPTGTGEWRDRMTNWYRNLFDGLEAMPDVGEDQRLVIAEEGGQVPEARRADLTWLSGAGLDRSADRRGLLVLDAEDDESAFLNAERVRVFRPISTKFR